MASRNNRARKDVFYLSPRVGGTQDVCFAIRIPFGGAWKIAWECWRHRERHTPAFKRNVDPASGRCASFARQKKKRKNARHRCRYFRREWPRCLEPPSSIDRIFQRSLTFDSIKFITIVSRGFGRSEGPTIVATRAKRRTK